METRVSGRVEDRVTGTLEAQTSRLPSSGYLAGAIACMGTSAVLKIIGQDEWALFVGQWVPSILVIGLYNKLVKQLGSDYYSRAA